MGSISTNDKLDRCLREILAVIKPSSGDVIIRYQIINDFKAVVESVESLRGATVEPFGSFVSNLYTRWGDLDISIEIPCGSLVSSAGKKMKQRFLRDVLKVLKRRGGVYNVEFVPQARVPLLIFVSNHQNISCDISISNLLGQIKSKFFLWITQIDDRFRDMVLLVKEWAKSQHINDPKTGTLNSYSLCMLVIFHFQTCVPAIFPPLQEIYAGNIGEDLTGLRQTAERNIQDTCTANIERYIRNNFRNVNKSSLSELFVSFFQKFSRINTMATELAICTYTGRWEDKSSDSTWTKKAYPLIIEDPFERPENAARAVSLGQLGRISEAFAGTYRNLVSSTSRDRNSLIPNLVRPHISSELNITRTPRGNPISLNGGGARYPPQQTRAVTPIQNQVGNIRYGTNTSPGVPSRRPGSAAHVQGKQVPPSPGVPSRRPGSAAHVQGKQVPPNQNQVRNMRYETSPSGVPLRRPGSAAHVQGKQVPPNQNQVRNMRYETSPSGVPLRRPGSAAHVQGKQVPPNQNQVRNMRYETSPSGVPLRRPGSAAHVQGKQVPPNQNQVRNMRYETSPSGVPLRRPGSAAHVQGKQVPPNQNQVRNMRYETSPSGVPLRRPGSAAHVQGKQVPPNQNQVRNMRYETSPSGVPLRRPGSAAHVQGKQVPPNQNQVRNMRYETSPSGVPLRRPGSAAHVQGKRVPPNQNRVRDMRYETSPSGVPLRRPGPGADAQDQQVWKPRYSKMTEASYQVDTFL